METIVITDRLRARYPELSDEQIRAQVARWRNRAPGTMCDMEAKQKLAPPRP